MCCHQLMEKLEVLSANDPLWKVTLILIIVDRKWAAIALQITYKKEEDGY